jgi:hypothetical protein
MMEMVMKKNEDLNEAHRTLLEREMKVRTKHFKEGLTGEREVEVGCGVDGGVRIYMV